MSEPKIRAHYLGVLDYYNLNRACQAIAESYDYSVYLVGSCIERKDFRDVDVRCILSDEQFDRMKPNAFLNAAISEWLRLRTMLPIDFQFQRQTDANAEFNGPRYAIGLFPRNSHE